MPGAKPKPTALKLLQGNPGKRPLNKNEPKPAVAIPDCPDHLSDMAKVHWHDVAGKLLAAKILTVIDGDALTMYCETYARWVDANDHIKKFGMVVKAPSGYPCQSPYLSISNKAFEQMKSILVEFGMTPSSRTKIATADTSNDGGEYGDF